MFHQISWQTYVLGVVTLFILYYGYACVFFFRTEIWSLYFRLTGNQPAPEFNRLIPLPEYEILGTAKPDVHPPIGEAAIEFGPSDNPDELSEDKRGETTGSSGSDNRLTGQFSAMISEVKTLIRVINDTAETRENFEMLFKLIVQKYPELEGTPYQQQVTEFLMEEGSAQFPFDITHEALESPWKNQ